MKVYRHRTDPEVIDMLKHGTIGVLPTDTLYGVVASIAFPDAIQRLYEVRQRSPLKGCITLIADEGQIAGQVAWTEAMRELARRYWPGPVSIVLPVAGPTAAHLRPVNGTLAFRMPAHYQLRKLLRQTGPLFAPSANPAGAKPAATIEEAMGYFSDAVDFYVDAGDLSLNQPSALIRPHDGQVEVLRGELPASG